jgi:hypothetical protein
VHHRVGTLRRDASSTAKLHDRSVSGWVRRSLRLPNILIILRVHTTAHSPNPALLSFVLLNFPRVFRASVGGVNGLHIPLQLSIRGPHAYSLSGLVVHFVVRFYYRSDV